MTEKLRNLFKSTEEHKKRFMLLCVLTGLAGGALFGIGVGYPVSLALTELGNFIAWAASLSTVSAAVTGLIVSVVMGVALTLPISSAAIGISIGLSGVAAGAAVVGCCCQMMGFAAMSFRENRWGGFVAQGLGTSMLQIPNVFKKPVLFVPPIISSAILGTVSVFLPNGAGIGLAGKEISLTSYGNDGALIKDSGIYMGSQDVEINTANPKIADKNTDLPAEGSVRVVSKAIQVEAVDYETKDDKTEEKSLTKEGSFTLRAEKINLNATDTEGKATGTIAANAKTVEVKAMDVDKEKRTDKELAAGSSLLLLAEKVYAGARDKKARSKSVQVASDKVGLFGDTTVELQQDGKAILQLSGGDAALSGSKTTLYGEMTSQGKSTFKSDVTAGTVEMKNLKVDSSFKTPYTTEGISVPGAPSTAKLSAKLSEEELKSNNG